MPLVVDAKDLGSGVIRGVDATTLRLGRKKWIGRFGSPREIALIPAAM